MGDWPRNYADGPGSIVGGPTASFSIGNTVGAWNELIASTPSTGGILVDIRTYKTSSNISVFDLAVGAAGSEEIIFEKFLLRLMSSTYFVDQIFVPLVVPVGSRVSIRGRCSPNPTVPVECGARVIPGNSAGQQLYAGCTTIGMTDTQGAAIYPSASASAKGNWVTLSSGLPHPTRSIAYSLANLGVTSIQSTFGLMDVAVGISPGDNIILPDLLHGSGGSSAHSPRISTIIPVQIPAGEPVSVRMASNSTTFAFTIGMYCFY